MEHVKELIAILAERLRRLAASNAVVAKPISVGEQHVVPLCELGLSFGGGGGGGEGGAEGGAGGTGSGAAAGGGAKVSPVAVLIVEGDEVRLEKVGK